jgi:A/G-specific adenine glycosylase
METPGTGTGEGGGRVAERLLRWYDGQARRLPWRVPPARARRGVRPDPYHVWLSEVMLQQTTVAAVEPYFRSFLGRWPTVDALAAASLDEVLHAWQGLGYYARARNLHRCAQEVSGTLGGRFPDTEEALRALPGIGAYTAAAIAAIAFDRPAVVVDGNVERVVVRLHGVEEPLPGAKPILHRLAAALTPAIRPGDFAQAMMDLGATTCLPRRPRCLLCPLAGACAAHAEGRAEDLPRRAAKAARPTRRAIAFWVVRPDGAVLLRRRPERGLLGGMMEVPSTAWAEALPSAADARRQAPVASRWRELPGLVVHTFTHFRFEVTVWTGAVAGDTPADGVWCPLDRLGDMALPTVMKKIVRHALRETAGR